MEMIETIKADYERWKKADAEWIDAILELAKHLAEARKAYPSNNDFGNWLDKNGVKINKKDRLGFQNIGRHLEIARQYLPQIKSRSPQRIWTALEKRCGHMTPTDSSKSKAAKKNVGRPRTREFEFAPQLLAAIRRKRKEANDVRITSKWRPEAVNKIMLHDLLNAVEQFLDDFINHRRISLDEINAIKGDLRVAGENHVSQDECRVREFDA